ncbi:MAG: IS66 family transposase [Myxococcales bacterium]|nr:IS66 family transposase [Myxococcales bacterium]
MFEVEDSVDASHAAAHGLVARVLVDQFADHLPANRHAKRMKREGFDVGSHTLSSSIRSGSSAGCGARSRPSCWLSARPAVDLW